MHLFSQGAQATCSGLTMKGPGHPRRTSRLQGNREGKCAPSLTIKACC